MDEISAYPLGAWRAEDAGLEVWANFKASFTSYQPRAEAQTSTVKRTVGQLQRLDREGGDVCMPKGSTPIPFND